MSAEHSTTSIQKVHLAPLHLRFFAFTLDTLMGLALSLLILTKWVLPYYAPEGLNLLQAIALENTEGAKVIAEKISTFHKEQLQATLVLIYTFSFCFLWAYYTLTESLMNGASLGKRIFNLQIHSIKNRQNIKLFTWILRGFLKTTFLTLFSPFLWISFLSVFWSARQQTLYDWICKTYLVVRPTPNRHLIKRTRQSRNIKG